MPGRKAIRFSLRRLLLLMAVIPVFGGAIIAIAEMLKRESCVTSVSWSPDGKCLAATSYYWRQERRGDWLGVGSRYCAVDRRRSALLNISDRSRVTLTDQSELGITWARPLEHFVGTTIAFTPDGRQTAEVTYGHGIRFWDLEGKNERSIPSIHSDVEGASMAFSPDGKLIATGGGGVIELIDESTVQPSRSRLYTLDNVFAFSPDGSAIAHVDEDDGIILSSYPTASNTKTLTAHSGSEACYVKSLSYSSDSQYLAAVYDFPSGVQVWNMKDLSKHAFIDTQDGISCVSFDPTNNRRLVAVGPSVGILEIVLQGDTARQRALADDGQAAVSFSADGKHFATGGIDGMVTIWDATSLQPLYRFDVAAIPILPKLLLVTVAVSLWIYGWFIWSRPKTVAEPIQMSQQIG